MKYPYQKEVNSLEDLLNVNGEERVEFQHCSVYIDDVDCSSDLLEQ